MTLTNLINRARGKNVVIKSADITWKGKLVASDKTFILLEDVYSIDNITGGTAADGQLLLPISGINYMQILTESGRQ